MTAQLRARSLSFNRGPLAILADVELTMTPGQRLGVVGPNGTGKSTLLQLLAGQLSPSSGRVSLQPPDATVVVLDQEILAPLGESAREYLARRVGAAAAEAEFNAALEAVARGEIGADDR